MVTAHSGTPAARTWRLSSMVLGSHALLPPADALRPLETPAPATAVALSKCGNFAFVGTQAGRIDKYNMQSGIYRGELWRPKQEESYTSEEQKVREKAGQKVGEQTGAGDTVDASASH